MQVHWNRQLHIITFPITIIQIVFKNDDVTLAKVGPMDPSLSNISTRDTTR